MTTPLRTVLDCATTLPFEQALAVADSALRHRAVDPDALLTAAVSSANRGRARRVQVAAHANPLADNPFDSVLRGLSLEAGLDVAPQVQLWVGGRWVRPDLLDESRALAIDAESFTWHGERGQLIRDCRKYNDLTSLGLTLLRFAWEQVMLDAAYTRRVLECQARGRDPWTSAAATWPTGPRVRRGAA